MKSRRSRSRTSSLRHVMESIPPATYEPISGRAAVKVEKVAADLADKTSKLAAEAASSAHEFADAVPQKLDHVGSEVAKRSTHVRAHLGRTARDVAQAVAAEAPRRREPSPRRTHRLRNTVLVAGAGAVAAYFLDPKSGRVRRENARRIANSNARAASSGFDKAARLADEAAQMTAPDPRGAAPATGR